MNDNMQKVDLSSFLENGYILLRCSHRYLIFDQDGYFLTQVIFSDQDDQKGEYFDDEDQVDNQNIWQSTKKKVLNKVLKKDFTQIQIGLAEQGL